MTEQLPTFQTGPSTVRPRSMDDLDACLAMDRDPQVARFVAGPWTDPAAHRAFVENRIRHAYPVGMGYWSIMAPDFVGWILLTPLDLVGPEIEIGWRIVPKARGRGYATNAARCVLDHAFNELRLPLVVADIDPTNAASTAVASKLSLRPTGTVPYNGRILIRYTASSAEFGRGEPGRLVDD